jgi:hypothetical protein
VDHLLNKADNSRETESKSNLAEQPFAPTYIDHANFPMIQQSNKQSSSAQMAKYLQALRSRQVQIRFSLEDCMPLSQQAAYRIYGMGTVLRPVIGEVPIEISKLYDNEQTRSTEGDGLRSLYAEGRHGAVHRLIFRTVFGTPGKNLTTGGDWFVNRHVIERTFRAEDLRTEGDMERLVALETQVAAEEIGIARVQDGRIIENWGNRKISPL